MSYCRSPYYIYPDIGGYISFDFLVKVPNDKMDVFLYMIYLSRREEFIQRVQHGKAIMMDWQNDIINNENYDDSEKVSAEEYKQWLIGKEDDLFKKLLSDLNKEDNNEIHS